MKESVFRLNESGKTLRSGQEIAAEKQVAAFVPIDFARIEAVRDPAPRADRGGDVA